MAKVLKLTYFQSSECEVTGKRNLLKKEEIFEIDKLNPGDLLYSGDYLENVIFTQKTPTGVIVKLDTIYTVDEGTVTCTSSFSRDGNHCWWYEFEIVDK